MAMNSWQARRFWWAQRTRPLRLWPKRPGLGVEGQARWGEARALCLFLSPPRSGHSLVGALLDAHPDAAIGHELDALLFLRWRWRLVEVLPLMERSARWAAEQSCLPGGYGYRIPGQGNVRRPLVVGDKHGEATLVELARRPWLGERLVQTSPAPLHWLRCVRHPLDNIATIARRIRTIAPGMAPRSGRALEQAEAYYFQLVEEMARAEALTPHVLDVRHETLLAQPEEELGRLAKFLGLEPEQAWLEHCRAAIRPSPHLSRDEAPWKPGQRERILERSGAFSFLRAYTFGIEGEH